MIKGLHHAALSVFDINRSIAFYKEFAGFEVARIIEAGPETQLGEVAGMPGCDARIAHLEKNGLMLELFEYTDPRGRKIPPDHKQADNGFTHVGFTSDDARADYQRLIDLDVKALSPPVEFRPGVWIFYFYGPDGEVCEVREAG